MNKDMPRTTSEILDYFDMSTIQRTVRNTGTYFYKLVSDGVVLVMHYDTNIPELNLCLYEKIEDRNYVECLVLNLKEKTLVKQYRISGTRTDWAYRQYPIIVDEDEHFQQMLFEDQYFPSAEEFEKIIDFSNVVLYDIQQWSKELAQKKRERDIKNWNKYSSYLNVRNRNRKRKKN